ncbi:MAG: SpoIIE family protein phosphatase [bacterium]|nr:SpoIIE family protein phosphatase [bacterium]
MTQSNNAADTQGIKKYIQKLLKEFKLKDSEAFYYSLVENIPQFIFCKDLEGRFTFVNQRFCKLLECSIDDVIGRNDFDFFPREMAEKYRQDDQKVIENNKTFETIEANQISDRETKYVHVIKTPIHDADGHVIGTQGIFWDITKQKKAEEELQNAHDRLKHDLLAAAKVQRGFIPERAPKVHGFQFSWMFKPSEYVSGDLLNVIQLDETHWAFYVMDVSGHGVPASLLSVSLTRMIDQSAGIHHSGGWPHDAQPAWSDMYMPDRVVRMLQQRFPGDQTKFCTLLYAILNTKDNVVTWIRAGHVPPLFISRHRKQAYFLPEPGGICISTFPLEERDLRTGTIKLEPGDRFIVYTDGLTEAMRKDEEFGYDRLSDVCLESMPHPLEDALRQVINQATDWVEQEQFDDDITLLGLERSLNGSA